MNGRAYDYNLGRFLSVDPVIQSPGNSQSLNPYSYIMNNPLAGTDPTGYCSKELGSNICSSDSKISTSGDVKISDSIESITFGKDFVTATSSNGSVTVNMNTTQMQSVLDKFSQIEISKNTNLSSQPTGIAEPLQGSSLRGMYYSLVRGGTLGIVYGEISSSPWLNADPQQSADIEAFESEAGVSQHFMAIMPGNVVSKAVPLIRAAVTKNSDGVFQFGDDLVKEIAQHQYSAGFNHLKQFMSPKEIKAYLADPSVASMIIGHAVHRATDAVLQRMHPGRFDYNATRAFDFLDRSTGQAIELTTKKGVRTHQNRAADIVTYD